MTPSTCWKRSRALLLLCHSLVPRYATCTASRFSAELPAIIDAKLSLRELRHDGDEHMHHRRGQASKCDGGSISPDVGECILLFGALYKADMGDTAEPLAVENLLASVAPSDQCFWYAHPWGERDAEQETHTAEISNGPASCSIPLTADYAKEVNRFKALFIGGGKLSGAKLKHAPLDTDGFFDHLTLPVVILGVGASHKVKQFSTLLRKASFLSGRDASSTEALSSMLLGGDAAFARPDNVALVRDPVLSDSTLTDTEGQCWKQSEGECKHEQPLCFVLPTSSKQRIDMHRHLVDNIVKSGDIFVNVSPTHQREMEALNYPGEVLQIADPMAFAERLCSCRAIFSTELHGAILGLHMGVPTLGAVRKSKKSDVRDLMVDTMRLPDQFFVIDEHLTRQVVDAQVEAVRESYVHKDRRADIHARLAAFSEDFKDHANHVLFDIIGGDAAVVKPEVLEEKKTKPSEAGSVKVEHPSISTVATHAAEVKDEGSEVGSATGESAATSNAIDQESPSLAAVLFANKAAFKRPRDPTAEPVNADPHHGKSFSASHHTTTPAGDEMGSETAGTVAQKMEVVPAEANAIHLIFSEPEEVASASKTPPNAPALVDTKAAGDVPTPVRGSASTTVHPYEEAISMVTLVGHDYITAVLLIAAIAGLAVLSSGGVARKPPSDKISDMEHAHGSRRRVASHSKSMCLEQATANPVRSAEAPPRSTGTSSKIVFMLNFTMWVYLSMGFRRYSTACLSDTKDPAGLLVLQGAAGLVLLCSLGRLGVLDPHPLKDLVPTITRQLGPAAFLYTCQALLTNVAVCVSEAATSDSLKATEPFVTAVLSYLLLGENVSHARMATLPVIIGGTVLMTLESRKDGVSAILAVAAMCFDALQNVAIKKGKPVSAHQTLLACSVAATVLGISAMLVTLTYRGIHDLFEEGVAGNATEPSGGDGREEGVDLEIGTTWPRMDGVNAALCFVGYNLASFNLLLRLSPVSHAVGNACKRMLACASGLLLVGGVMTIGQLGGTAVALFGVLTYNFIGTG
ncbi:unnamed protein product [Scytosiphon promiscuus]